MNECGVLVERYWQEKTDVLGEKPLQVPLCLLPIQLGPSDSYTRSIKSFPAEGSVQPGHLLWHLCITSVQRVLPASWFPVTRRITGKTGESSSHPWKCSKQLTSGSIPPERHTARTVQVSHSTLQFEDAYCGTVIEKSK